MEWRRVEQAAYPDLKICAGALIEVSGPPGSGKSTLACRLADAVAGPALVVAAEEGISPSLAARLARAEVRRKDFAIMGRGSVETVAEVARKKGTVSAVLDSVQEAGWSAADLRDLLEAVPSLELLVAVLQVTKDGLPAGAMSLQHECDVHVSVEAMRWKLLKSRYQDLEGVGGPVLPRPRDKAPRSSGKRPKFRVVN